MMSAFLKFYFEAGVALLFFSFFFAVCRKVFRERISASFMASLAHLLIVAALVLPWTARFFPAQISPGAVTQTWSSPGDGSSWKTAGPRAVQKAQASLMKRAEWAPFVEEFVIGLLTLMMMLRLMKLAREIFDLRREIARADRVRKIGRVSLFVSENAQTAYSAWLFGEACTVVPQDCFKYGHDFRLTVLHELQHHRQRDTVLVYFHELLKILFFWNPAVYQWTRVIRQLQEFSCDENLIGRQSVSSQEYGGCLLRAAQSAVKGALPSACTLGMAASFNGQFLKRRIEMIMEDQKRNSTWARSAIVVLSILATASLGFAFQTNSSARTVSMDQAKAWAQAASGGEIPLTINDLVLNELNYFVGTDKGRAYVRDSFARMNQYKTMISDKLNQFGEPAELAAVPAVESGYQNKTWTWSEDSSGAAGLWGFIKTTAVHYGLVVNDTTDERLDETRETVAAARYFSYLQGLFQDWRLALLGYNLGENHVQSYIDELGTRDPWAIERAHNIDNPNSDEHYLARMTAMILIMKNPQIVAP